MLLGSQRVRQDRMIYEGLLGAQDTGKGGPNDPVEIALARVRQLAVHETGHALGFGHNFAGSTIGRASVDDYPPPRVLIRDGRLDFSDAYARGVGAWDLFVVNWLYSEAPPGADQRAASAKIVADGFASGLRFVSDDDARPVGSANPMGSLWDDGPDPVDGLRHTLDVRRIAIGNFGLHNVPLGAAVSDLKRVIVPVYLFHRYEVDADAKLIGGVDYTYAANGDGHERSQVVSGDRQRAALHALLDTVDARDARPSRAGDRPPEQRAIRQPRPAVRDRGVRLRRDAGVRPPGSRRRRRGHHLHRPPRPRAPEPGGGPGRAAPRRADPGRPAGRNGGCGVHRPRLRPRSRRGDCAAGSACAWCSICRRSADDKRLSPSARAAVETTLVGLAERVKSGKAATAADRAFAVGLVQSLEHPRSEGATPEAPKIPPGMPIGGEPCEYCEGLSAARQ